MAKVAVLSAGSIAARKAWETMRARGGKAKPVRQRPKMEPHKAIKLPKEVTVVNASEMMLRTVVLAVTYHSFGNRRKIDSDLLELTDGNGNSKSKQEEGVDKEWINATKKLIEADELQEINSIYGETKRFIESRVLPSAIKQGIYLLPKAFDEVVVASIEEANAKIKAPVERIIGRLGEYKKEAKKRLQHLYNEDDYPTAAELRESYGIHWRLLRVDSAEGLSKELAEKERKKAAADAQANVESIRLLLRSQLKEFVDHLVDKLKPDTDGRPKTFKATSITKMSEFLGLFKTGLDITNDQQMQILVDNAQNLVAKADPELLREDKTVRDYLRHGFETIKILLDPMVVKKPHRTITITD